MTAVVCCEMLQDHLNSERKEKEKLVLFSDHNGSLLGRQPGALISRIGTKHLPVWQTRLLMFARYSCRTCLYLLIDCCQAFWTRLMCVNAGPNAPLVLERGLTSCHMEHVYDFYKPAGLYPKVCHRHFVCSRFQGATVGRNWLLASACLSS